MADTLCIAELADGRRALAYMNPDGATAQLVLVLRDEDLIPRSMRLAPAEPAPVMDSGTGLVIGEAIGGQRLQIPPKPPAPRITADDLVQRGRQLASGEAVSPEDQILRDIQGMADDGDAATPA